MGYTFACASVVECGGKLWRDTAVASRTVFFGLNTFFRRSKAVSPMQGVLASLPPHSGTLRASDNARNCSVESVEQIGQLRFISTSPTGLRHAAQGCAERYPGIAANHPQTPTSNRNAVPSRRGGDRRNRVAVRYRPNGVARRLPRVLRTLGCMTEGRWPSRFRPHRLLNHATPTRCGPATSRNASEQRCQSTRSIV
jgi:hypothetical protein